MFIGSVFAHISIGAALISYEDLQLLHFIRQANVVTTQYVTIPGLLLLVLTGVVLTWSSIGGFFKLRWLTLHQALALLILANALFILRPVGQDLLLASSAVLDGTLSLEALQALESRELTFGPLNLLLTLLAIGLAVFRPSLGQHKS